MHSEERSLADLDKRPKLSLAAYVCLLMTVLDANQSFFLSLVFCLVLFHKERLPFTLVLAEVVVCAVGRVVTLPTLEITAQATALLVLGMSCSWR